jgi:3-deoxy-7-phosphoheptulonate synthase
MYPATSLAEIEESPWDYLPAREQPTWHNHPEYQRCRTQLGTSAPLVTESEIATAHRALASVAVGDARLLQAGDCAESFAESDPVSTAAKVAAITRLGNLLAKRTGQEVVRFGRMAGQYAKPRSNPTEIVNGVEMPVFRGHLVNAPDEHVIARHCDPRRLLRAYWASGQVLAALRTHWRGDHSGPWVSHEALVMDYESPQVHKSERTGRLYLGSTHFPWIGERTRQLDHAQVSLLSAVSNPVACKVGPKMDPRTVVTLCGMLDPERIPGRLTLIVRMGEDAIDEAFAPIAHAVRRAGHPVIWLSDPMHGNTVKTSSGKKTRHLNAMIQEASRFRATLEELGQHAGGLHLEVAAADVTECVGGPVADEDSLGARYESLCDPRLNPEQAHELIEAVF